MKQITNKSITGSTRKDSAPRDRETIRIQANRVH